MNATQMVIGSGVAAAAAVGGLLYTIIHPASRFWGPLIDRGSSDGGGYALTFDDGPTPGATDQVLDELGELGIKAAFFVIGQNAAAAPGLLRRIHEEGHLIANHTYDHSHYGVMRLGRYWREQIVRTDQVIKEVTGVRPMLFRPPMGVKSCFVTGALQGRVMVTWSRRAMDGLPTTPERIVQRLTDGAAAGDILLMHDGIEPNRDRDPAASIAAIRPLCQQLAEKGLQPIRLDRLIGISPYAGSEREAGGDQGVAGSGG